MSHFKERKQKDCLNCNAMVSGRYCGVCGQENIEPSETVWQLITHFFYDLAHFDGKFFSTLKYLVTRPGFLSSEYKRGRRASYVNPIRMYLFTSAVFFLIFFSLFDFGDRLIKRTYNGNTEEQVARMDSAEFRAFTLELTDGARSMTREQFKQFADSVKSSRFTLTRDYRDKAQYDSALKAGKKHNWFERQLTYKQIEANEKYKGDQRVMLQTLLNNLTHSFPQMLFISLPLFALFLKLLYARRHKDFYYVSHAIFTVHLYIFTFIVLLLVMLLQKFTASINSSVLNWLQALLYIAIFVYEYKAMRNFYGQGRAKTIVKWILLNAWLLFIIILLFTVFLLLSYFKV